MNSNYQRDAFIAACSIEKMSSDFAEAIQKTSNDAELRQLVLDYSNNLKRVIQHIDRLGASLQNDESKPKRPIGF
jgi:hypothetical protein